MSANTRTTTALRMAYVVASVAGIGFFVLSVLLLGYWPKRVLDADTKAMAPEAALPLSASEERGRAVYAREGCAYCHTQQVRYLETDEARFGAPTLAWETRFDYPHLWGTRRIGPDLARAGGNRPDDWHYQHFYAPRSVVSQSVMPAYRTLFDGDVTRPTQEARDLVAYLNSLGRARELAGPEGEARAHEACHCPDDEMMQMAFHGPVNVSPARTRRSRETPALPAGGDIARGQSLYVDHCASCHGSSGQGDGPGAAGLSPAPANLADHDYTAGRVAQALWNGVAGTAMSGWRDHPPADLAALVTAVRALRSGAQDPEPADGQLEQGSAVYQQHCAQCHGARGDGQGTAAAQLAVAPADFTAQRATLARATTAIRRGVPGTPMAPFTTELTDADVAAVAHYVRTLYAGAPGAARP